MDGGLGPMPAETRAYVQAITGASVEQWAKAAGDADSKQQHGPACGELMALLKRAPNRFVAALEQRVVAGALQPWGVILGADKSRDADDGPICRTSAAPRRGAGRVATRS